MRARVVVGGVVSSAAVLLIGWQLGGQPAVTTSPGTGGSSGSAAGTGASSGSASGTGGTAGVTATPSPSASAGSGTSGSSTSVSGTFEGAAADTRYGPVQVEIIVSDGKITDVKALHLTDRDGRSVEISDTAAPVLRQEALAAQSSSIQGVSGATYTSDGYITSLQSAIDKAGL
jgi:uncharacterized protein with FMN-binding domain